MVQGQWQYYATDRYRGGPLELGYPTHWFWPYGRCTEAIEHYDDGHDFFWVHWEVKTVESPDSIRLHIESPSYADDHFLNSLKQELIAELLASNISHIVQQQGFEYRKGRRISPSSIRQNKCTEAFRVNLTDKRRKTTNKEDIDSVHAVIGPAVDVAVKKIATRLDQHFLRLGGGESSSD